MISLYTLREKNCLVQVKTDVCINDFAFCMFMKLYVSIKSFILLIEA